MVSTRGIKLKFYEGERVLCYEPDPTKAKVLYDSKVLDIVVNKDHRGRRNVEYLIHFQGWNSSWDRCVKEEYVLKDTPENRQLQKDLAEKSQLQLGAYLYRRERKKHSRKPNERATQSSEEGSSGSPARMDTEESASSSSEDNSSIEEDTIPIELTEDLKNILEHDYHMIHSKNKFMIIPIEPNVVTILESYWRHYAVSMLCGINEKTHGRHRTPSKLKPEEIQRNLTICKEMIDGLRIYFDFTLKDLLLYKKEESQIETAQAKYLSPAAAVKQEITVKAELEDLEYAHLPNVETDEDHYNNHDCEAHSNNIGQRITTRRRGLRSGRSLDVDVNGAFQEQTPAVRNCTSMGNAEISGPTAKLLSWKLLPEHTYSQHPPPPSLVYGATHLLRLLVKLPELLNMSSITENKLKVLLKHLDTFVDFLDHHKEWYGDKYYQE